MFLHGSLQIIIITGFLGGPIVAGCGYSGDRVDNRTWVQHGLHDSLSVTPVAYMIPSLLHL